MVPNMQIAAKLNLTPNLLKTCTVYSRCKLIAMSTQFCLILATANFNIYIVQSITVSLNVHFLDSSIKIFTLSSKKKCFGNLL